MGYRQGRPGFPVNDHEFDLKTGALEKVVTLGAHEIATELRFTPCAVNKKQRMRKLILPVLFCAYCATPPLKQDIQKVARPESLTHLKFYLQPWQQTAVFINGQKLVVKPLETNKTLGFFSIPVGDLTGPITLGLQHVDFPAREIELRETDYARMLSLDPPLYQLLPDSSPVKLVHRWQVGKQPKSVTFLDNRRVILPYLDDKKVELLDIHTGERSQLPVPADIANKESFVESVVIPSRGEFWVSQMSTHSAHAFSAKDLTYLGTITTSGKWSKVLHWDEGRGLLYLSNWNSKDISVLDPGVMKELRKISLPGVPRGMVLSDDGKALYVVLFGGDKDDDGNGRLLKINPDTGKILLDRKFIGSLRHIVRGQNPNTYYFSNMSRGYIAVLVNDEVVAEMPTYHKPNTIVLDKTKRYLYVSTRGPNNPETYLKPGPAFGKLQVFDVKKQVIVAEWEGGDQPTGLDLSPDGRYLVSSDFLNEAVRVYEILPPLR